MPCVTLSYSNWFLSLTISNTMPKTSPDSNNRPQKKRGRPTTTQDTKQKSRETHGPA